MSHSEVRLEFVGKLGEEFIERLRRGEHPSVREYTETYPEHRAEIEELFPALAMMEDLAPADSASLVGAATTGHTVRGAAQLDQLGDYRILREVGRGGMGIVYEAEQISLGRHVALKVLPKELLSNPKQRMRFEREARAAAKLHHTNIVPVFGVGSDDEVCYYVMQFIQGLALDVVVEELRRLNAKPGSGAGLPTGELRIGHNDATAAAVAHSLMTGAFRPDGAATEAGDGPIVDDPDRTMAVAEGECEAPAATAPRAPTSSAGRRPDSFGLSNSSAVMPRAAHGRSGHTAKPYTYWQSVAHIGVQVADALQYAHAQGVLHRDIKPSNLLLDMRGTVWVTDFGLARLDDERGLTQTGDVLGTLRYMAPESFKGHTDERSELYSLGLTLYELLAFRPAFDQTNRNSLVDQVMNAQVEPLRKRNPEIPRDLETIIQKAIDRDPEHRYQTGQELADDLQRFIEDEPIQARRATYVEQLVRWSRHNTALAASFAVISALGLALAIGSLLAAGHFSALAEKNKDLANRQTWLAGEKEVERRGAEKAKSEALAAKDEVERQNLEIAQQRERAEQSLYASRIALANHHLDSADTVNAQRVLTAVTPKPGETDRRGWEWHYLTHWSDSATRRFDDHHFAYAVAFSPNGRLLASAGGGNPYYANPGAPRFPGEVLVRDLATGRVLRKLTPHSNIITALAFSPDGKTLATAGPDQKIVFSEVETGRQTRSIPVSNAPFIEPLTVRFSASGRYLIVLWRWLFSPAAPVFPRSFKATVYSVAEARLVHSVETTGATLSHDGSRLYWLENRNVIKALDLETMEESPEFAPLACPGECILLECGQTGRVLAAGFGQQVLIWDLATRQLIQQLFVDEPPSSIAFGPDDGLIGVTGSSGVVRLFEVRTGVKRGTLLGNTTPIRGMAFSPDSQWLATAELEGQVRLFRANQDARGNSFDTHETQISAMVLNDDGTTLETAGWLNTAGFGAWDTNTGANLSFHEAPVSNSQRWPRGDYAFSPDGHRLAAPTKADPTSVRIWDTKTGEERLGPIKHPGPVTAVVFSPDGTRLATAYQRPFLLTTTTSFQIWDAETGQPVGEPRNAAHDVRSIQFSRDGKLLAIGGEGGLSGKVATLWDLESGKARFQVGSPGSMIYGLAFSPDGSRLAGADYRQHQLLIWDTAQGSQVAARSVPSPTCDVAYTPDGTRLAAIGYDADVHLFDAATFDELLILKTLAPPSGSLGFTPRLAFSGDGMRLAGNSPLGIVTVWCAENALSNTHSLAGRLPAVLRGEDPPKDNGERLGFAQLAFDGKQFAAATRLYVEAYAADPTLADGVQPGNRYDAARAAIVAGSGQGNDAPQDEAERARLRGLALGWLREHLAFKTKYLKGDSPTAATDVQKWLDHWTKDPDLAAVRDAEALAKLAESEQREWQTLWTDSDALRERAASLVAQTRELDNLHRRGHALEASNPGAAEPLFRQALEGYRTLLGPDAELTLDLAFDLGNVLARTDRFADAEPLLREALAHTRKLLGREAPHTVRILVTLGLSLIQQSKWTEAEPVLHECLAVREKTEPDAWTTFSTRSLLGASLLGQKKYDEAEPLIVSGYEGMKAREASIPPPGLPRLKEAADRVIQLYDAWGKPDKAAEWRARLAKPAP